MEKEQRRLYRIPDNFLSESRILGGMIKTRFFIEGIILGVIFLIPALNIPVKSMEARVSLITFFVSIPFFIGCAGILGDPVSVFLKNFFHWISSKKRYRFDKEVRPLKKSPLDDRDGAFDPKLILTKVLDDQDKRRKEKLLREESEMYETFVDLDIKSVTVSKEERHASIFDYLIKEEEERADEG